ncbi:unnamed protein product [Cuscuta campestris]|uniref:Uncharacterized protein n=1 Tax=Cuscuta campestris TaxID=132261 RepID=A0A484KS01_9ASTE|nr:unnamed protein product [Cuscuta campestris]
MRVVDTSHTATFVVYENVGCLLLQKSCDEMMKGGAIAEVAAKKPIPTAAVRRTAVATPAVLAAAVAAGVPTRQQHRAAGSAQRSPLPIEKEEGRPHLEKTRHGVLKLEKRSLGL